MAQTRYGKQFTTRRGKRGAYKYIKVRGKWKRVAFVRSRR